MLTNLEFPFKGKAQQSAPKPRTSMQSRILYRALRRSKVKTLFERTIAAEKFETDDHVFGPEPPRALLPGTMIKKEECEGRPVYRLSHGDARHEKAIVYFHGGGYIFGLKLIHWLYAATLAEKTGYLVIVPDYPLAPRHTAPETLQMADSVYRAAVQDFGADNVIVAGDSAGGGLALSVAQEAVRLTGIPPRGIILHSPWLDLTLSNPEIETADKMDPVLGIAGLKEAGILWSGSLGVEHPRTSPLRGEFNGLRNILTFTGTNEIFLYDCRLMKAKADPGKFTLKEYRDMVHVFPLLALPESAIALKETLDFINNI